MVDEENKNPILLPMKKPDLTPLLLSATLFLAAGALAAAQEAPPAPPAAEPGPHPMRDALLKQFDKNGDGQLDETERAEARQAVQKKHPRLAGEKGSGGQERRDPEFRRGWMLGKFDQNGDGQLDKEEHAAARAEGEKRMRAGMEKQLARLKSVDADGDGKISDAEWAVAKEKHQQMRAEHGRRGEKPVGPPPGERPGQN